MQGQLSGSVIHHSTKKITQRKGKAVSGVLLTPLQPLPRELTESVQKKFSKPLWVQLPVASPPKVNSCHCWALLGVRHYIQAVRRAPKHS